ncbi:MAG: SLC13 family permease [Desulforhabdus sp.]|jgi:di/tricarboxylate transporter|nr:SLC13 family permease [Desulforhabdus sp.]
MTSEQITIIAIIIAMIALFIWDRWRHDFVSVAALLGCVFGGLVPAGEAFAGFGHPAVITVAGVLILSGVLQSSGVADYLMRSVMPRSAGLTFTIAVLVSLAAIMSAFMNNVGTLALLMPVAIQLAARQKLPPGRLLMPLAFGSILGGMTTLIGTPPNLIVSGFRAQSGSGSFAMFDFSPVGLAVAGSGILFIAAVGWRLVPVRKEVSGQGFEIGAYLTEARVPEKSKADGMLLEEIETALEKADAQVVGLVRNEARIPAPNPRRRIRAGDILVIEADPPALRELLSVLGLKLEEDTRLQCTEESVDDEDRCAKMEKEVQSGEVVLAEMVLFADSSLSGRTVTDIRLRTRYGINLLAVSRQGRRTFARLRSMHLAAGDVLLLQGERDVLNEFAIQFDCAPLAERALHLPSKRKAVLAGTVMAGGVSASAFGLVPAAISFVGAALACVLLKLIPPRRFYDSVDWSVVVLLGALMPVAQALETSGTAALIARWLVYGFARGQTVFTLVLILIVTMTLSDFMNNAATAAVMCPIAINVAQNLTVSADPFLMAVAVGSSCAFLTPIGHQNNTLILGPGGFRFGDYWRLGLPLEIIVIMVGVPMLLLVWPL